MNGYETNSQFSLLLKLKLKLVTWFDSFGRVRIPEKHLITERNISLFIRPIPFHRIPRLNRHTAPESHEWQKGPIIL